MIDPKLIELLRCPQDGSPVTLAPPLLIDGMNRKVRSGTLQNVCGAVVSRPLDGGLVRSAGDLIYPIFDDIPVMLRDEAIAVDASDSPD